MDAVRVKYPKGTQKSAEADCFKILSWLNFILFYFFVPYFKSGPY